jgi:hypothetical protein
VDTNIPLYQVLDLLKQKDIEVALNVGEHQYCSIQSNCPMAIKLRKMIEDMGLVLDDALKDYKPDRVDPLYRVPAINPVPAELTVTMGGEPVKIDMSRVITQEVKNGIESHFDNLRRRSEKLEHYAQSLHQTYMNEIYNLRKTKVLPALDFSITDLHKAGVYAGCSPVDNMYIFYTPMVYEPHYLYSGGIRYEISDEDKLRLYVKDLYLKSSILQRNMTFYSHTIIRSSGTKLVHYHGDRSDCWGNVKIAVKWDGTLRNLSKVTHELIMSIITINGDSLMRRDPTGFPTYQQLFERARKIGREGEMTPPVIATTTTAFSTTATTGDGAPVRWGRRTNES